MKSFFRILSFAASLSAMAALGEPPKPNVVLIFVDDPTQNLDLPSKERMAEVVAQLAGQLQVIISSQDEDFVNELKSQGFSNLGTLHAFAGEIG